MVDTALRELYEETGYEAPIDVYECIDTPSGHAFVGFVPEEFAPELNWEHDAYAWFDPCDVAHALPQHPALERLLESEEFWQCLT
jgi:8-oxo-dGTP pyrophosphatase MutT (NUDIX family)